MLFECPIATAARVVARVSGRSRLVEPSRVVPAGRRAALVLRLLVAALVLRKLVAGRKPIGNSQWGNFHPIG